MPRMSMERRGREQKAQGQSGQYSQGKARQQEKGNSIRGEETFADIFKFWMSKDEDDAANRATAYEAINRYAAHVGIKKAIKDAADLDKLTEKECEKIAEVFEAERKAT